MIYTVTTNPNIDYYMDLRAPLRVGGINRSGRELLAPGGKGINVSLMLQTLGKPSCVLGYLAGPTGRLLEALMKDTGCDCHWFWLQSGQTRINTKINTSPETAFNASGPALGQADINALCAFLRGLNPDDQLVVSGNLQKSPPGAFSTLLSAAQEAGVSAVVDTSGAALREALAFRPLLIKPNGEELCELFGRQASTPEALLALARQAQTLGARNVLVSMGADGALLLAESGDVYRAALRSTQPVISTVGAGDSVTAGFLAGLLDTGDYSQALRLGAACGSATAYSPALANRAMLEAVLPSGRGHSAVKPSERKRTMQTIQDLFSNRVLLSGLIGWGAAQVLKTIIYALMHHTLDLTRIFGDGGMPSGHSATVCAVATSAGIIYGLDSFPFAISVIVAIIVMHDAMGVRLETGKQAKLLNEFIDLFAKLEQPLSDQEKLKELVGHTPLQVCTGGLLGILTGVLCNLGG